MDVGDLLFRTGVHISNAASNAKIDLRMQAPSVSRALLRQPVVMPFGELNELCLPGGSLGAGFHGVDPTAATKCYERSDLDAAKNSQCLPVPLFFLLFGSFVCPPSVRPLEYCLLLGYSHYIL